MIATVVFPRHNSEALSIHRLQPFKLGAKEGQKGPFCRRFFPDSREMTRWPHGVLGLRWSQFVTTSSLQVTAVKGVKHRVDPLVRFELFQFYSANALNKPSVIRHKTPHRRKRPHDADIHRNCNR